MKFLEKLGVPDNLIEVSRDIHKKILNSLKNINHPLIEGNILIGKYDIKIPPRIYINDVPFYIEIVKYSGFDDGVKILSASLNKTSRTEKFGNRLSLKNLYNQFSISFSFVVDDKSKWDDLVIAFNEQVSSDIIAHEFKHLIDSETFKKSIFDMSEYLSVSELNFPDILNQLLHLMYFTSTTENLVRNSEVYMKLLNNKVKKSNFYDFITNDDIIEDLNKGININLDDLIEELDDDSEVEEFLNNLSKKGFERTGKNSRDILNIFRINLSNKIAEKSKDMIENYIKANGFNMMFNKDFEKEVMELSNKEFEKIINRLTGFKNDRDYFEYLIKRINLASMKTKKKIFKLYDMLEDDMSIINWDLHNKINSKKNETRITIDFNQFKLDFKKIVK
jgi:hypothetical protein